MEQEWRIDPIRLGLGPRPPRMTSESHVGSTWSHVLLDGRGTVGETALHMCFLLDTPAHRNLATVMLPIAAGFPGVATVPAPYSTHVIFVCRIGA